MKKTAFLLLLTLLAVSAGMTRPVLAQTETPPAGPTGKITGTIVNRNSGKLVPESLEVMLHILDKDFAELDMKHAQSLPGGTFAFAEVPFDASLQYAVMAIYNGVTYVSDTAPADMTSLQATIDVPVYESTSDPASIQVDQMHVLFGIAEDGLEIKEIYAFANTGERTVKDAFELEDNKFAALKFPLPEDADFIFFKPEDQDRFVKFSGGFADTYPVLPGGESSQIMVSYLVPYSGERTYTYTAPLNIAMVNFLVPDQADISLKGSGLMGPESMTLQEGSYLIYSYSNLKAGQTASVSIAGKAASAPINEKSNTPFAIGAALLGFAVIGAGIWWWRRPDETEDTDEETDTEMDSESDEATLDELIARIARLDELYEQNGVTSDEYQDRRQALTQRAKQLL